MPELEPYQSVTEVVDPFTGSLVDVSDPMAAAEFLDALRQSKETITKIIHAVEGIQLAEFERQGTKTIHAGRWDLELESQVSYQWDEEVLHELLDAGLPEERYQDLVKTTVSVKVLQGEAKRLEAANPAYAEIIGRARTRVEKPPRVSVKPSKQAVLEP
jgi:hypothetical protein